MTDKELLELAARAAGYKFDSTEPFEISKEHKGETYWFEWNPLIYDGDALRLAVKLNIGHGAYTASDLTEHCCAYLNHRSVLKFHRVYVTLGDDPYAATRRAIVLIASEVGKEML